MKLFVTMADGAIRDSFITDEIRAQIQAMGDVRWNNLPRELNEDELIASIGDAEAVLAGWGSAKYTKRVLDHAKNLRAILYTGGSVADLVDDEAYDRGVRVLSGNEVFAQSVGESVVAYALIALRRIPDYLGIVRDGGWRTPDFYNEGLLGQKVGLVGFGAVGRNTAKLLRPFGVDIYIHADHVSEEEAASYGARKASLEEIFSECRVVSIHWARTPETHHGIGERLLSLLKVDSLLINTARGACIDEPVLIRMLQEGRFRAVLDVYEIEPPPLDSPLRALPNVYAMPHMGGPTVDRRPFVTKALLRAAPDAMEGRETWLDVSREAMKRMTR